MSNFIPPKDHLSLSSTSYSGKHGRIAENLTFWFLKSRKFTILSRNFKSRDGELDLVACRSTPAFTEVRFVEVKALFSKSAKQPQSAVTYAKQKRIIAAARYWILKHRLAKCVTHFDIAAIRSPPHALPRIYYIKDAFFPRQDFGW